MGPILPKTVGSHKTWSFSLIWGSSLPLSLPSNQCPLSKMSLAPSPFLSISIANYLFQFPVLSHLNYYQSLRVGKPGLVGQIQPANKEGFYIFKWLRGEKSKTILRHVSILWNSIWRVTSKALLAHSHADLFTNCLRLLSHQAAFLLWQQLSSCIRDHMAHWNLKYLLSDPLQISLPTPPTGGLAWLSSFLPPPD